MNLHGSITALATPFKNGAVDEKTFERFVDWQIAQGTHALVANGTTAESPTLSEAEQDRLLDITLSVAKGRVPVIAGTGSNNTAHVIHRTLAVQQKKADAALIVAPYYNKPTQEGLYQHYKAIHDATNIPIILYNAPGRTIADISNSTVARLAQLPRIIGIKDATGDLTRPPLIRAACKEAFLQFTGNDDTAFAHLGQGGIGCISVISNVAPALCAKMQEAWAKGDLKTAFILRDQLAPLAQAAFLEPNPTPIKYALSLIGFGSDEMRLPLLPCSENVRGQVKAAMEKAGLLNAASAARCALNMSTDRQAAQKFTALNRKARFDYAIEEKLEAGIVLTGTEVKALRAGLVNIAESHAGVMQGDIYLFNANISEYTRAGKHLQHEARRPRKLLLHKRERAKLIGAVQRQGATLVPLALYFNAKGKAKLELAVAKGRKKEDKRAAIKEREWKKEQGRALKNRGRE